MNDGTEMVTCKNLMTSGVIVARYPQKFFVSFTATATDGSAFFVEAYYSKKPTQDLFLNAQLCSDKGLSVEKVGKKEEPEKIVPVEPQEPATPATIVNVTTFEQRTNQMVIQM